MGKFYGFKPQVIEFLEQIKENNNKSWFDAHYDFYHQEVLETSRDFVEALGEQLLLLAPGINVSPKVNGSIYRFARDARFSRDKTPYKTHLSYLFWQGNLKRTRCPGFYLSLRPEYVQFGVGINHFTPEYLEAWRQQCIRPDKAQQIRNIIDTLVNSGAIIHGEQLKRLPRGYSELQGNALFNEDLIRYKGLKCWFQLPLPDELYSNNFVPLCIHYYQQLLPLFEWMVSILGLFTIEPNFSGQP